MSLLVIGFDGLDARLCKAFKLSFIEKGHLGIMRSLYGATVPSWTSIYTGLKMEEHHIGEPPWSGWRDWISNQVPTVQDPLDKRPLPKRYERAYRSLPFVWNELQEKGFSVGLFGMPLTFPPFRVKGWCVSGFPCLPALKHIVWPSDLLLWMKDYPADIFHEVASNFVETMKTMRRLDHGFRGEFQNMDWKKFLLDHVNRRLINLEAVHAEYPVDVLFVGFSFLDHAGHAIFYNRLQLENCYVIANLAIERLFEFVGARKTILISDHGGEMVKRNGGYDFVHRDTGVNFIKGDELHGSERSEYEIKEEILRLVLG